ncbi:MAG: hypothetical protein V4544_02365 [Pseudomonadota bacterium]
MNHNNIFTIIKYFSIQFLISHNSYSMNIHENNEIAQPASSLSMNDMNNNVTLPMVHALTFNQCEYSKFLRTLPDTILFGCTHLFRWNVIGDVLPEAFDKQNWNAVKGLLDTSPPKHLLLELFKEERPDIHQFLQDYQEPTQAERDAALINAAARDQNRFAEDLLSQFEIPPSIEVIKKAIFAAVNSCNYCRGEIAEALIIYGGEEVKGYALNSAFERLIERGALLDLTNYYNKTQAVFETTLRYRPPLKDIGKLYERSFEFSGLFIRLALLRAYKKGEAEADIGLRTNPQLVQRLSLEVQKLENVLSVSGLPKMVVLNLQIELQKKKMELLWYQGTPNILKASKKDANLHLEYYKQLRKAEAKECGADSNYAFDYGKKHYYPADATDEVKWDCNEKYFDEGDDWQESCVINSEAKRLEAKQKVLLHTRITELGVI